MEKDHGDLHVILRDGLIDLRQENFEGQQTKTRSSERAASEQKAPTSQASGDTEREPLKVNVLRKFASNLYHGQQPNVLQKSKSPCRNTLRNRAASADPRFRRERSPSYSKDAGHTQSDSKVIVHSPIQHAKESAIPKPKSLYRTNQSEHANYQASDAELKRSETTELFTCKSFNTDKSSFKYATKCESLIPANNENSTMTDEVKASLEDVESKKISEIDSDKKVTELKNPEQEFCSSSEIYLDENKSLTPHWDDPRLIEKYSNLLKPVRVRKSRSSWTLPLTTAAPVIEFQPLCRKCGCTRKLNKKPTNVFEACEEEQIEDYEKIKLNLYNVLKSNYYMAGFFMIGSVCGLMVVALVVWVIANDIIWSYMNNMSKEEVPKVTGFKWFTVYVGGAILHSINVLCNKLYYMITMPRNEAFDTAEK